MKIKDFSTVITGTTPCTNNKIYFASKDYMFITPEDLKNNRYIMDTKRYVSKAAYNDNRNKFVEKNSILVDCIGSDMGNVSITTSKSLTNQQINAITNINQNLFIPKYLYYLLCTYKHFFHLIGSNR